MKEKIYIIVLLLLISSCLFIICNSNNNYEIIINNKKNKVLNSNTLTMMYETSSGSGEYEVSSDTSWPQEGYIFNERLSGCENGSTLTWDDENKKVLLQTNTSDKCYVYFDKKPDIVYLADYIKRLYTSDGENGIYLHDGVGTYTNADQEAGDNSYRYAGANPNNFVCFGSTATTCPNDNLYRIIGVFGNQVKLIKHDYATISLVGTNGNYLNTVSGNVNDYKGSNSTSTIGVYYWSYSANNNTWRENNLNTINLNQNYLNNIGSTWSSKIATTNWKAGGNTRDNIINVSVKTSYQNEIVSPAEETTYCAKIGLMYVSDYGYATSPENWDALLYNYNNEIASKNNWMYMGLWEWTISRRSDNATSTFGVINTGSVNDIYIVDLSPGSVRPTFYLKPEVSYVSGDGSQNSPFKIECTTCTSN